MLNEDSLIHMPYDNCGFVWLWLTSHIDICIPWQRQPINIDWSLEKFNGPMIAIQDKCIGLIVYVSLQIYQT